MNDYADADLLAPIWRGSQGESCGWAEDFGLPNRVDKRELTRYECCSETE
jgi:hypothetical protein